MGDARNSETNEPAAIRDADPTADEERSMRRQNTIAVSRNGNRASALATAVLLSLPAGLDAQATGRAAQQPQPEQKRQDQASPTSKPQAPANVTAGNLADDPARYYGQRVSISAPVESVYSRTMFTLDEDKVWSTGRDVLVLNPRPTEAVKGDASVTVTGVVHIFSRAEIERLHDGWDWDVRPELIMEFGSRPVLVAESIRDATGKQLVSAAAQKTRTIAKKEPQQAPQQLRLESANGSKHLMTQAAPAVAVTAGNLADHPDRYFGKRVTVTADVEDVYTATVFALDEDKVFSSGEDVLVVARELTKPLRDDMYVTVVGEVKRFSRTDADLDAEDFGLRARLATGFADRPVIVASSIRTASGEELLAGS
jgi:hypothetical protein